MCALATPPASQSRSPSTRRCAQQPARRPRRHARRLLAGSRASRCGAQAGQCTSDGGAHAPTCPRRRAPAAGRKTTAVCGGDRGLVIERDGQRPEQRSCVTHRAQLKQLPAAQAPGSSCRTWETSNRERRHHAQVLRRAACVHPLTAWRTRWCSPQKHVPHSHHLSGGSGLAIASLPPWRPCW